MAREKKKKTTDNVEILDEVETKKVVKKRLRFRFRFRSKHKFGPIELTFDIISIILVCTVGFYFLGRGFYYYSAQHKHSKEVASTLNGLILENNRIVNGATDGLHQDEDGHYFKGNVENNYVWFANRMYRVIRVNKDETVKLVQEDLAASFMWGEDYPYDKSNLRLWLTKLEEYNFSGVYQNTIPNTDKYLAETKYTIDKLKDSKVELSDKVLKDKVSMLSLNDYILAGGKSSYLNTGKLFFLLGYNGDDENIYVEEDGSLVGCSFMDGYGVRPIITLNKNIPVSAGTGAKDNPYIIDQGKDTNYVDSYVKLGDDIWKVYEQNDGKIKMYLNGYIMSNGQEVVRNYSNSSAKFDYYDRHNIGYYLAGEYYESLPYKDILVDNSYYNGEIGSEQGCYFGNVTSDSYTGKVSLLSIFDYVSNNEINDFFRNNTDSELSTTQYAVLANGLLYDSDVTDSKHIVPVVSIDIKSIKSGSGKLDNPFVVG